MGKYTVQLSIKAKKFLDKLSDNIAEPIFEAIQNLGINPRPNGYIKLKSKDAYRIRVGNYRIIYEIYDDILLVDVIELGHRKDVYK